MARVFTAASSHYLERTAAVVTAEPFTISAWARPSSTTVNGSILSLGSDTLNQRHLLYMTSANRLAMFSGNGGTTGQSQFVAAFSAGTWTHTCGVVSATNSRTAYVNGSAATADTTNVTGITPGRTYIGAYYVSGSLQAGFYWPGDLAEVAVWNVALSSSEIAALADRVSPMMVRPDALVSYVPIIGRTDPEPDLFYGGTWTVSGAAQATHVPMRYPGRARVAPAAGVAGGLAAHPLFGGGAAANPIWGYVS